MWKMFNEVKEKLLYIGFKTFMVNKHINALKSALVISQVNAELKTCSVSKTLVFNSAMT
jgi:hypothetical protein